MYIQVKVIPRSKETALAQTLADGTFKIRIKAAPEKGRANKELIIFLAKHFQVPKSEILIVSGHTDPHKLLKIPDYAKLQP